MQDWCVGLLSGAYYDHIVSSLIFVIQKAYPAPPITLLYFSLFVAFAIIRMVGSIPTKVRNAT